MWPNTENKTSRIAVQMHILDSHTYTQTARRRNAHDVRPSCWWCLAHAFFSSRKLRFVVCIQHPLAYIFILLFRADCCVDGVARTTAYLTRNACLYAMTMSNTNTVEHNKQAIATRVTVDFAQMSHDNRQVCMICVNGYCAVIAANHACVFVTIHSLDAVMALQL